MGSKPPPPQRPPSPPRALLPRGMDSYQPNDQICMLRVHWYARCALREPQRRPLPSPLTQTARYKGPMDGGDGLLVRLKTPFFVIEQVSFFALSSQLRLVNLHYLFFPHCGSGESIKSLVWDLVSCLSCLSLGSLPSVTTDLGPGLFAPYLLTYSSSFLRSFSSPSASFVST